MKSIKLIRTFCLSVVTVVAFYAIEANATLLSKASSLGADTVTLDTSTGLEWLDLSVTYGESYLDVQSKLGAGGQYEGFHYAQWNEIFDVFGAHSTPSSTSGGTAYSDYSLFENALALIGPGRIVYGGAVDSPTLVGTFIIGIASPQPVVPTFPPNRLVTVGIKVPNAYNHQLETIAYSDQQFTYSFSFSDPTWGSWLVRQASPVPEPNTWLLLMGGLVALSFQFRRAKNFRIKCEN